MQSYTFSMIKPKKTPHFFDDKISCFAHFFDDKISDFIHFFDDKMHHEAASGDD